MSNSRWLVLGLSSASLLASSAEAFAGTKYYVSPTASETAMGLSPADPATLFRALLWLKSGDSLELAKGRYKVGEGGAWSWSFSVNANVKIKGAGAGKTILDLSLGQSVAFTMDADGASLTDLSIENFSGPAGVPAVSVAGSYVTIENVILANSAGTGIAVTGFADPGLQGGLTLKNSVVSNHADIGLSIGQYTENSIQGTSFTGNPTGVYVMASNDSTMNTVIRYCNFKDNGIGIYSTAQTYYGTTYANHVFEMNLLENSGTAGIVASGTYEDSVVNANDITISPIGISANSYAKTKFTNNVIKGSSYAGALLETAESTIAFNTFVTNSYIGVFARSSDSSRVVNNIIHRTGTSAFYGEAGVTTEIGANNSFLTKGGHFSGTYVALGPNTTVDPQFVGTGDFHSRSTSPLRNAAAHVLIPQDHDLKSRVVPDVGAFEY